MQENQLLYYIIMDMEDRIEYFNQLKNALEIKAENLEHTTIQQLRGNFQEFGASISTIYNFLIDKGMLQSDPYRRERSVTKIQVPSSEILPETDTMQELSLRLSHYTSQWEFLVNIFHICLENFSLKNVHQLIELLNYIRWTNLSTSSSYQITRSMADVMARVSQMNDPMAGKIILSSASNLGKITNSIKAELKTITAFLRERYKVNIREKLTNKMNINIEQYRRKPSSIIDNVKFEFTHTLRGTGWYKDLINELLEEDYSVAPEKLRLQTLDTLKVSHQVVKRKKKTGTGDKAALLIILERMSRTGEPIRSTLLKLNENSRIIQERKKSFGERLSILISTLFSKSDSSIIYEVTMNNPATGSLHIEPLNFTNFSTLTMKKARLFRELHEPGSSPQKKAESTDIEHLMEYINRNLNELKIIHRKLTGLDGYFQSKEIPQDLRNGMKSSKVNLKNLRSIITDTMKMFSEFKLKIEEEKQLIKLGIED